MGLITEPYTAHVYVILYSNSKSKKYDKKREQNLHHVNNTHTYCSGRFRS